MQVVNMFNGYCVSKVYVYYMYKVCRSRSGEARAASSAKKNKQTNKKSRLIKVAFQEFNDCNYLYYSNDTIFKVIVLG